MAAGSGDMTQVKPHSKSTAYRDQHYYRGYHPNLAANPPGRNSSHAYDAHKESSRHSWAGLSSLGEASGQPQEPSLLQQYRESGLSSSSYELSQYIHDGAEPNDTAFPGAWSPVQRGGPSASAVVAPHKFLKPHVPVCLGAGGQLVLVCPHRPTEGQLPLVELHSLEVILQDTKEQEELQAFPGPLARFTSTLATNDPLQTFFQLMSGRIPQAAQSCGDSKWGDWRPHLAVLLSNKVGDMELNHRAIVTMGDTLAGKGAVEAAHFCYLMADIPFGYFGVKADRMALLGSSHRQAFTRFATTEAIQRMEIFEYCQHLRHPTSFLLPFQVLGLSKNSCCSKWTKGTPKASPSPDRAEVEVTPQSLVLF
ncbi:hypothetical protein ASZ78_001489 [Callipepla squamata]|uniref:Sec16 Sec23-binding domain-containing protein n=1 Tax=Callipepla squamata TaxID=9009 RepID=A0A226MHJ0_CALSU|nr:hypothetical protein ASZ78_001489 [Callipepla squamata]